MTDADYCRVLAELHRAVTVAKTHVGQTDTALGDALTGPVTELAPAIDAARTSNTAAWDTLCWLLERFDT